MKSFKLPMSALAVLAVGAVATTASAQFNDEGTQRYFGLMGTYSIADDDRGLVAYIKAVAEAGFDAEQGAFEEAYRKAQDALKLDPFNSLLREEIKGWQSQMPDKKSP